MRFTEVTGDRDDVLLVAIYQRGGGGIEPPTLRVRVCHDMGVIRIYQYIQRSK